MLIITVSSRGMLWKRERGKKENGFFFHEKHPNNSTKIKYEFTKYEKGKGIKVSYSKHIWFRKE